MDSAGYFDTFIPDDRSGYHRGAWTAYPYLDDQILVNSIGQGLFILRPRVEDS